MLEEQKGSSSFSECLKWALKSEANIKQDKTLPNQTVIYF